MNLLHIADWILFAVLGIPVLYLFVFALFSLRKQINPFPAAKKKLRFVTLIPAYKGDEIVEASIRAALAQDYPSELHEVVVIADHFRPETVERLSKLPIRLLPVEFENSSKAKALNYAVQQIGEGYDVVTILDVDNLVSADFIPRINDAFAAGVKAVQAHRTARNRDTDTAVLDAASEEINNSIFRRGHVAMGISSALIGSGMAFDYTWFRKNIVHCTSAGEDKELEVLLLRDGIFIDYLEEVIVLDEKVQKEGVFYNQRRRWLAAQFHSLGNGLKDLPGAILSGNIDYADKLFQWMLPPRILLMGFVPLATLAATVLMPGDSVKWWVLTLMLLFTLALALPDSQMDDKLKRAIRRIPTLFILMAANLFRLRGASKKFIHTEHATGDEHAAPKP